MTESEAPQEVPLRVVIVDDDPLFTSLAVAALRSNGFDVRTASDGVEGLEWIDAERFDLAIVDLNMPRVDGLRLIALVRGAARHSRLAIMVVSARVDPEVFREALLLGADAIGTKPVNWALLPERVKAVVDRKRSSFVAA